MDKQSYRAIDSPRPISNGVKKLIASAATLALLSPTLALAVAFNDVTLTTDTVLSVNSLSLSVSGSSAVLESITVEGAAFEVVLGVGSSIKVVSTARATLAVNYIPSWITETPACSEYQSELSLLNNAGATTTMTISPSATLCSGTGATGSSGGSSGGGGGKKPVATTTPITPAPTPPPAPGTIDALRAQVNALLAQLAVLTGKGTPNANAFIHANANASFIRSLTVGATGDDVRALQVYLNTHGYALASSGAGSAGSETTTFGGLTRAALAKFQAAHGITPSVGYFGPKTRAYVIANP